MKKYLIERTDGDFMVYLIRHKESGKFSFVNLTKGHICPCQFNTVEEDFKNYNDILKITEIK